MKVVNWCLETYIHCFASEQPKELSQWTLWAELWYTTAIHVAMGTKLFETVYGREPPTVVRFLHGETKVEALSTDLVGRDEALRQLKMKRYADKKRKAYSSFIYIVSFILFYVSSIKVRH